MSRNKNSENPWMKINVIRVQRQQNRSGWWKDEQRQKVGQLAAGSGVLSDRVKLRQALSHPQALASVPQLHLDVNSTSVCGRRGLHHRLLCQFIFAVSAVTIWYLVQAPSVCKGVRSQELLSSINSSPYLSRVPSLRRAPPTTSVSFSETLPSGVLTGSYLPRLPTTFCILGTVI